METHAFRCFALSLVIFAFSTSASAQLLHVETQSPSAYRSVGESALSPDDRFLYVVDYLASHINVYERDLETAHLDKVNEFPSGFLASPISLEFTTDGRHLYTNTYYTGRLARFDVDTQTGALTLGELHPPNPDLDRASDLALSPGGENLYAVGGDGDSVAVYSRDAATGNLSLTQTVYDGQGGITGLEHPIAVQLSPDGKNVYVSAFASSKIVAFTRNLATGELTHLATYSGNLGNNPGVRISPDGAFLYAFRGGIRIFSRDASDGALTLLQTVSAGGSIKGATLTPDGSLLYVCARYGIEFGGQLVGYARDPNSGLLTEIERIRSWSETGNPSHCFGMASTQDADHHFLNNLRPVREPDGSVDGYKYDLGAYRHQNVACSEAPLPSCRRTLRPGAASLILNRKASNPRRSKLKWKWKGEATWLADLRDPINRATDYAVCTYDALGLIHEALAPGASHCGDDAPCWSLRGPKLRYEDREALREGLRRVEFKPGDDGRASASVQGKGEGLELPLRPLVGTVTLQIQAADAESQTCWEATFPFAKRNTDERYRARSN